MSAEVLPLLRKSLDESEATLARSPTEPEGDSYVDLGELEAARASRAALENKLVRKLDLRMSILVVIYVLNYVRESWHASSASALFSSWKHTTDRSK